MATTWSVQVQDKALRAALDRAGRDILPALMPAMWQAELLLMREIRDRTPAASGITRESIQAKEPVVIGDVLIGEVGSSQPHIEYVELGTKPHRPPIAPIEAWVRTKLGLTGIEATRVAWAVAGKIAKVGTEGAFMFRDGFDATQPQMESIMRAGLREALVSLGLLQ